MRVRIELVPFDREWAALYSREERRIKDCLGDRVRALEHVGSTSVPGLLAKPVIDIVLAVSDSADEGSYVPQLRDAGYTVRLREPEWYEHRLLNGPDTDINLHVFSVGCPEIERMTLFRDQLRGSAEDRERYAEVKRTLASRAWPSVQVYADAKTAVVSSILDEASLEGLGESQ
jgi:GrpB-like predicted nucleotidyltransferase (UPF0157 family)